jgi:hypothetical protein
MARKGVHDGDGSKEWIEYAKKDGNACVAPLVWELYIYSDAGIAMIIVNSECTSRLSGHSREARGGHGDT